MEKDDENARDAGEDEVETVQMGVRASRDLESGLEKTHSLKSARSAKDLNLVSLNSNPPVSVKTTD